MIFRVFYKLIIWVGVLVLSYDVRALDTNLQTARPRLTIWVHGTTIRAIVPIKISFFHFDSKLLHFKQLRPGSLGRSRALVLNQADRDLFDLNHFYLFRWNGMLNYSERQKAARQLYQELVHKVCEIKQKNGVDPIVTIVAHSHGGNVALLMADLNDKAGSKLEINKLILLACPVQNGTASWIAHETFKKVYVFYSQADWIQRLALQNGVSLADRKFDKIDQAVNKIVHIHTSWKNYQLWHNDFKKNSFLAHLPRALRIADQHLTGPNWTERQDVFLTI